MVICCHDSLKSSTSWGGLYCDRVVIAPRKQGTVKSERYGVAVACGYHCKGARGRVADFSVVAPAPELLLQRLGQGEDLSVLPSPGPVPASQPAPSVALHVHPPPSAVSVVAPAPEPAVDVAALQLAANAPRRSPRQASAAAVSYNDDQPRPVDQEIELMINGVDN